MVKKLWEAGKVAVVATLLGSLLASGAWAGEAAKGDFTNIGAKKCKMCHNKEATGAQFAKWEAGPHAKAFETLGTPEAAALAKEHGVEGSPQESPKCMKCHSTAWGMSAEALAKSKITLEEGVSCESCHGAGSAYWKKKTMTQITAGELDGAEVGLVEPNEALCVTCHNKEFPGFEGFDFEEFSAKIAHPVPGE